MTYNYPSSEKATIAAALSRAVAAVVFVAVPVLASASVEPAEAEVAVSKSISVPYDYTKIDPALYPEIYYGKSRLNAMTFKVNAVAAAALITNATFELEWKQWSVQLPMYYSNLDYFSHRVRFRIAAFQPGIRYWFGRDTVLGHTGFFAGAHFGLAWYNMSLGGSDRIQDHKARTPALGGGLEGGWRRVLGKSGRWKLELSLGVGVYRAHYDHIDNRHSGAVKSTVKKAFVGIDHVGVSFGYTLDLKKGGNKP
ncbi:MAG: DUF3575 domain-containing protein [Muribaculaceae bacterium]|nr:DUF3575 domain-containing protein [Muribaculaceae bacterium]